MTQEVSQNKMLFDHPSHSPSFAQLTNHFTLVDSVKDYSIPINPYFPDVELMKIFLETIPQSIKYYPTDAHHMIDHVCQFIGHNNPKQLVLGNGSTELITWLNQLYITDSLALPVPSFGRWTEEPKMLGRQLHPFFLKEELDFCMNVKAFVKHVRDSGSKAAVICNPNNPTGTLLNTHEIEYLTNELKDLDILVIDESFIDFSCKNPPTASHLPSRCPNLVVLKSMGKNLGLHGIRAGYMIADEVIADRIRKILPYWNVNGIVESLFRIIAPYQNPYNESLKKVLADREYMLAAFSKIPIWKMYPSGGNFVYLKLHDHISGQSLRDNLFGKYGCLVRSCGNKLGSSSQYFRIAVRPKDEIDYLVSSLDKLITQESYTPTDAIACNKLNVDLN